MVRDKERWSREEIREIHNSPVLDLIHRAATVHREFHDSSQVQMCALLSIKTGRVSGRLRLLPASCSASPRERCLAVLCGGRLARRSRRVRFRARA